MKYLLFITLAIIFIFLDVLDIYTNKYVTLSAYILLIISVVLLFWAKKNSKS